MLNEEAKRRAKVKQESKQKLLETQRPFTFYERDLLKHKKKKTPTHELAEVTDF